MVVIMYAATEHSRWSGFEYTSPYMDDAGLISRFIEKGHDLFWIVFSTAEGSLPPEIPKDTLKCEFLDVVRAPGLDKYDVLNFKVRYLDEPHKDLAGPGSLLFLME